MPQQKQYSLHISVSIRDNCGGGHLEVRNEVQISAGDFLDVAKILGQFKELADSIKKDTDK